MEGCGWRDFGGWGKIQNPNSLHGIKKEQTINGAINLYQAGNCGQGKPKVARAKSKPDLDTQKRRVRSRKYG